VAGLAFGVVFELEPATGGKDSGHEQALGLLGDGAGKSSQHVLHSVASEPLPCHSVLIRPARACGLCWTAVRSCFFTAPHGEHTP